MVVKVKNKKTRGAALYTDVKRVECHDVNGKMQWALLNEQGYFLWLPAEEVTIEAWEVK